MTNLGKVFMNGINRFPGGNVNMINLDPIIEAAKNPSKHIKNNDVTQYQIAKPARMGRITSAHAEQNSLIPCYMYSGDSEPEKKIQAIIDEVKLTEIFDKYPFSSRVKFANYNKDYRLKHSQVIEEVLKQISKDPATITSFYCSPENANTIEIVIDTINSCFSDVYGKAYANIAISGQTAKYYGYLCYVYAGITDDLTQFIDWSFHLLREMTDAIPDIHMDINPLYPFMWYVSKTISNIYDTDWVTTDYIYNEIVSRYFNNSDIADVYDGAYTTVDDHVNYLKRTFGIESEIKIVETKALVPDIRDIIQKAICILDYDGDDFGKYKRINEGFDLVYAMIRKFDHLLADSVYRRNN